MSRSQAARNPASWQQTLASAAPGDIKALCESALEIWPASTEIWTTYIRAESNETARKKLMKRALPLSVDPRLYSLYIEQTRAQAPDELGAAFEFALEEVSADPDAGPLWKMYIDFLSSREVHNEWEEQHRMDEIRKAYKRASALPLSNVETLWKNYGQFETGISRVSARKFMDDRSPAYMRARTVLRTYRTLTKDIDMTTMQGSATSLRDAPKWRQYLAWEAGNPLELPEEDFKQRLRFAYRHATNCARWSPVLWFDAGSAVNSEFWQLGAQAMPESFLLSFKLADHYEQVNNYDEARAAFLRLATYLVEEELDPTPGWAELVRCTYRMLGKADARKVVSECIAQVGQPTAELYIAAAGLEADDRHLSDKIWAFGNEKFGTDPSFAMRYITHLFEQGDSVNARAVFERAVAKSPRNRSLWDQMLKYEATCAQQAGSNLEALRKLEDRYAKEFASESSADATSLFMRRFVGMESLFSQAGVGSETQPALSVVDKDSKIARVVAMLPPASVYDGPVLDNQKLLQLISSAV